MMNKFMNAMDFRHACKIFDEHKKVSDSDMRFILESGQKSPSSFGLEPWHFLVIADSGLKQELRAACWEQVQLTTCSHVVVLLARNHHAFKKGSLYLEDSFRRRTRGDTEKLQAVKERFARFAQSLGEHVGDWAKMQVYLASGNMMTSAAYIGIDSCPIEGFEYDKVHRILKEKVAIYQDGGFNIAYILTFGYRINEQSARVRQHFDEIVTFL